MKNLYTGSQTLPFNGEKLIKITSDAMVNLYGVDKEGEIILPLGYTDLSGRLNVNLTDLPIPIDALYVKTDENTMFRVDYKKSALRCEIPDPVPIEIPYDDQPLSMEEQMRRIIRSELANTAHDNGLETFEEADDFDIGEKDQMSKYEELDEEFLDTAALETATPEKVDAAIKDLEKQESPLKSAQIEPDAQNQDALKH